MGAAELDALAALLAGAPGPLSRSCVARRLGIGDDALAARVSALQGLGAPVAEDGHGLRLAYADALDADAIRLGLAGLEPAPAIDVCHVCESTNARAGAGAVPRLCLAEVQTAGRGRRGNDWVLPFAAGLALSYGARLRADRVDGLAIAMAVAVAEALRSQGFEAIGLKWPNDLYARGAKLGGVMVEAAGGRIPRLVVGVGLNVHSAPRLEGRPATALRELGPLPPRNALAVAIACGLAAALSRFEREGFAPFGAAFARLDVLAGRTVKVAGVPGAVSGVARGVGPLGEIMVETPAGLCRYTAGEVSLGHV